MMDRKSTVTAPRRGAVGTSAATRARRATPSETSRPRTKRPTRQARELLGLGSQVLAPLYKRPDALFVRGDGCYLEDDRGERFLDMTSGIGVVALGHGHRTLLDAIGSAGDGLVHTSNLFHTEAPIRLAAELVNNSFADRVCFVNSGAEAVEASIKFARLQSPSRCEIVYFDGSFHGRTLGALAATDRPDYRDPFHPLPGGFVRLGFESYDDLSAIGSKTAAVLVEPIQGESGIRVASSRWLQRLRMRCNDVDALLVFDEIQCGLGRTGRLWAGEVTGVTPDMMTLAKPLAGGLPMGAVLLTERVSQWIFPGCHGTTFGGGPAVARTALEIFRRISRPEFLSDVRRRGALLRDRLENVSSSLVREIRGRGLMLGIRLDAEPAEVAKAAFEHGLLIVPAGDRVVRMLPPLVISDAEIEDGIARFSATLASLEAKE